MDKLNNFFIQHKWDVVYKYMEYERNGEYEPFDSIGLSKYSMKLLEDLKNGIYRHQRIAIENFINGENICLSTSTASGKTLVFHVSALEILNKDPEAKIIAIYPILALAREQEMRWKESVEQAGVNVVVNRIDGSVSKEQRVQIIMNSSIIIMTPDVIHAWLLRNLDEVKIQFIEKISLIIIDEAHTYTGVFGSNSAFLYRRLQQAIIMLNGSYQFIAGSATIKDPLIHLDNLTGLKFSVIDNDQDTSPKKNKEVILVDTKDNFKIAQFLRFCKSRTKHKFIAFIDSRKQVESFALEVDKVDSKNINIESDFLNDSKISPYRAGYEHQDHKKIMDCLRNGQLKGVISTSAIEMGIDLPGISLGILIGIPPSATSFYQRIGRVGRHGDGVIVIINDGSDYSEAIFKQPEKIKSLPLVGSSIYMENKRIQFAHAQCLMGKQGEYTSIQSYLENQEKDFKSYDIFPESFIRLCKQMSEGDSLKGFNHLSYNVRSSPHLAFPLRNLGNNYTVKIISAPIEYNILGSLTETQVLREAYPGAIYMHQKRTYRVLKVNKDANEVLVTPEKKYITKPDYRKIIRPYLTKSNYFQTIRAGDIEITECKMYISELVLGYEKIYSKKNKVSIRYPISGKYAFNDNYFSHAFFSTGVLISHPFFFLDGLDMKVISKIIYQAFLMTIPFDRNDINFSTSSFSKGLDRRFFIVIYDDLTDGLKLTEKLMDYNIFQTMMFHAIGMIKNSENIKLGRNERKWLKKLEVDVNRKRLQRYSNITPKALENRIILPEGTGINIQGGKNKEFYVEDIVYIEEYGICYKGKYLSESKKTGSTILPIDFLVESPDGSEFGFYKFADDGEILLSREHN